MTLLRIIAVFILIYLAFRIVTMYVMPWLIKKFLERQRKKFYGEYDPKRKSDNTNDTQRNVKINYKQKRKISSDDIGEYVDFKEINDNDSSKKEK